MSVKKKSVETLCPPVGNPDFVLPKFLNKNLGGLQNRASDPHHFGEFSMLIGTYPESRPELSGWDRSHAGRLLKQLAGEVVGVGSVATDRGAASFCAKLAKLVTALRF